ncbi:mitotic checkpoint serine/threonine-protein kinase BUB1 beta [Spea bombifrons]|uniref:mitotic checkpoint serine/threonine-protein kinase BUB1 beta n=1 Tax=Spea bombifrons TaxID=233779 RepID=UPI002349495C|nr:mitotic checkpoint serine/threonine-protein kinase BUB1 beta [Spea bombifrons]
MAQASDEWELSKENVQPLRQGRVMSTLQEVLSQPESTSHVAIQQQKQAFELELRFYTGDDPLDVWDRYIKWAEQTFPQGGKESNLSPLLERAVKIFHEDKRYYGDLRYLTICLKFAHFCSEPLDLYSYLHSQQIGISHAILYITWAEEYEAQGNYKKADSIFQEGIQRNAEPSDKLKTHHRQFQARVSRQVLKGITEGADDDVAEDVEPQRNSLIDLKCRGKNKARAPVSRVGDVTKSRSQGLGLQESLPQQIPSRSQIPVFDENAMMPLALGQPPLNSQPWPALPPARAKENEQKAGRWNSGRSSRSTSQLPNSDLPLSAPSFTPYVDETAEQLTVTPCKINPAVTSVLSSRKPGKEEDPLQRVQNHSQEKEEMVMYCKSKVYAGMEEFSLEEIRAEIYMAKLRKKREEELEACAQRRLEMERKIEEMEKLLKSTGVQVEQKVLEQSVQEECCASDPDTIAHSESEVERCVPQHPRDTEVLDSHYTVSTPVLSRPGIVSLHNAQENQPSSMEPELGVSPAPPSDVPFTIFDESSEMQPSVLLKNPMPPVRRPLAVSKTKTLAQNTSVDVLDGMEPLTEEAIVCGSHKNKSLFPDPEDTCDFVRAAQLASTPFNKARDELEQSVPNDASMLERLPLREKTPVYEESYRKENCIKKLSPILEASQEDARSSVSSVSSVSSLSNVTGVFPSKTLQILDRFEHADQITGVCELSSGPTPSLEIAELHKQLLEPMCELFGSPEIQHEAGPLPAMKDQEEVTLSCETYTLKSEILLNEKNRLYTGVPADSDLEESKGVVLKVAYQPVPWDLYILLQLKERLGNSFETDFLEQSSCCLYQNGCITLYKDVNCFSIQDILHHIEEDIEEDIEEGVEEVIVLVAYNLLNLVEKLHSVEIVHGDLRPEILLMDDGLFNSSACTEMDSLFKLVDFSNSMDLRLCPTMNLSGFPVAQTEYGQQIHTHWTSPYQVDLFGIADVVHLLIFRSHLQVHYEDGTWKIKNEIPRRSFGSIWDSFFGKILNGDGESTADILRDLKEEMKGLSDSCFQDKLCNYLVRLQMRVNV